MASSVSPVPWNSFRSWAQYEQLSRMEYSRVNWAGIVDFQHFVSSCPRQECCVGLINKKRCPIRCRGCKAGLTRLGTRRIERETENAAQEARDLTARAEKENPGLFTQEKLWLPHAPGVALIRGDLLADVANFFRDCDITVREHNEPTTNRCMQDTGNKFFELSDRPKLRCFMRPTVQVRVQIDKFRPPPDTVDLEHPEKRVLCNMRGEHGNAMHRLILFLGFTGQNRGGDLEIDKECSYWYYFASGFDPESTIGDTPFRMVRVSTEPAPDVYEIMLRLGLARGKNKAKHFRENFNETVREWRVNPESQEDLISGCFDNVLAESGDDDELEAPELTDPSEDTDVTNLSDVSGPTDRFGVPITRGERAALDRRIAEAQAQAESERLAAQAADEERLDAQVSDEREAAEPQDPRLRRIERREAARAERELAEAQAAQERRSAEAAEKDEVSQTESGGTLALEEAQNFEERESGIELVAYIDPGEEADVEDGSESDRPSRFPRFLSQGAKV